MKSLSDGCMFYIYVAMMLMKMLVRHDGGSNADEIPLRTGDCGVYRTDFFLFEMWIISVEYSLLVPFLFVVALSCLACLVLTYTLCSSLFYHPTHDKVTMDVSMGPQKGSSKSSDYPRNFHPTDVERMGKYEMNRILTDIKFTF